MIDLGETLKDGVRASTLSWSFESSLSITSLPPLVGAYYNMRLTYELLDIAGTNVGGGTMFDQRLPVPVGGAATNATFPFSISGSCPDAFNIQETSLSPPVRSIKYLLTVGNFVASTTPIDYDLEIIGGVLKVNYDIPNGLTDGIIQTPIFISYDGIEIGTQISVNGSLLMESAADSATAKFVQPLYRKIKMRQEKAILKILSNPGGYGLRWMMRQDQHDTMLRAIRTAIALETHKDEKKFLAMLEHFKSFENAPSDKPMMNEASIRSILNKGWKGLKKAGTTVYKDVIKPVAMEEYDRLKNLPKHAASELLKNALSGVALGPLAMQYDAPQITYKALGRPSGSLNSASTGYIPSAATGYLPRAATSVYKPKYVAATRRPRMEFEQKPSSTTPQTQIDTAKKSCWKIPLKDVTLFPTVNFMGDELTNDDLQSTVEIFAIVPNKLLHKVPVLPTFTFPSRASVTNYTAYPNSTNIDTLSQAPKEPVTLLRVKRRNLNHVEVETTDKPVGGRSLDLAMYAFNNGLTGGFVYTGTVQGGLIGALSDEMMLLKKKYCDDNSFITVGNGPYTISVGTLTDMLRKLRGLVRLSNSKSHYNAATGESLFIQDLKFEGPRFRAIAAQGLNTLVTPFELKYRAYPTWKEYWPMEGFESNYLIVGPVKHPFPQATVASYLREDGFYDILLSPKPGDSIVFVKKVVAQALAAIEPLMRLEKFGTSDPYEAPQPPFQPTLILAATKRRRTPNLKQNAAVSFPTSSTLFMIFNELTNDNSFQELKELYIQALTTSLNDSQKKLLRKGLDRFEETAKLRLLTYFPSLSVEQKEKITSNLTRNETQAKSLKKGLESLELTPRSYLKVLRKFRSTNLKGLLTLISYYIPVDGPESFEIKSQNAPVIAGVFSALIGKLAFLAGKEIPPQGQGFNVSFKTREGNFELVYNRMVAAAAFDFYKQELYNDIPLREGTITEEILSKIPPRSED